MYVEHVYTPFVNTPSHPQTRFDCGQSGHMKTCTEQLNKVDVN
jgi:hypothetical protein